MLGLAIQVLQSVATGIVPVSITEFSVPPGTLYYGQALQYGAEVTSNPPFPGPFYWYNGTQTIATLPSLDNATTSGAFENGIVSHLCHAPLGWLACACARATAGQYHRLPMHTLQAPAWISIRAHCLPRRLAGEHLLGFS